MVRGVIFCSGWRGFSLRTSQPKHFHLHYVLECPLRDHSLRSSEIRQLLTADFFSPHSRSRERDVSHRRNVLHRLHADADSYAVATAVCRLQSSARARFPLENIPTSNPFTHRNHPFPIQKSLDCCVVSQSIAVFKFRCSHAPRRQPTRNTETLGLCSPATSRGRNENTHPSLYTNHHLHHARVEMSR